MSFSLFTMTVETFTTMLGTLSQLLEKGAEHARTRQIDPGTLVQARLAPDMYPLAKQVQFSCELACRTTARLMGAEAPSFPEDEESFAGFKSRIQRTLDYLRGARESAFAGAEERPIELPIQGDLVLTMPGHQLLRDWGLPNFYFHVVTAYAIMRHHGVDLGKRDFMTHVAPFMSRRS